jgi:hypothetical protein
VYNSAIIQNSKHIEPMSTANTHIPIIRKWAAENQGPLGDYFQSLLLEDLGRWEEHVLALLVRSTGYRENNLPKLLELVNDVKTANQAQIDFVIKYCDELFLPGAVAMEREQIAFLNTRILPYLTHLLDTSS